MNYAEEKHYIRSYKGRIPEVQLQAVKQVVSWLPAATFGNPSEEHEHVQVPLLCPLASSYEVSCIRRQLSWIPTIRQYNQNFHAGNHNIHGNAWLKVNMFLEWVDPNKISLSLIIKPLILRTISWGIFEQNSAL